MGGRVAGQAGAVLVVLAQLGVADLSQRPQGGVERASGVPLGQDKAVFRGHDLEVEVRYRIHTRQVPADMADAAVVVHLQQTRLDQR